MSIPDTIFYNGEIYALDADDHLYEAMAVKKGKISAVGSNEIVLALRTDQTKVIDLKQKTVVPGFTDAHLHLFSLGFNLSYVDCQLDSIDAVKRAIQERAKHAKCEDEWIIGWGFDESKYKEKRKPSKWDFADVKNPIYITRYCLHEAVINEAGIAKANITSGTEIEGGIIERNPNGELTGIIKEKAMGIVENQLPAFTTENMSAAIKLANDHLVQKGITSVHDAGLGFLIDPFKEFNVLKKMSETNSIQVKMYVMILAEYFEGFMKQRGKESSDQLKIGSMKLFADGTLSGKTAAMFKPYKDSSELGILHYSDEELEKKMKLAYDLKKQVAIHAIGDRAIDQAIKTHETLQPDYPHQVHRPRIEHTTVSNENMRTRMKKIHAIPIPQPALIHAAGDMYHLDKKRLDNVFALKSLIDYGLRPPGSSDAPVVNCSPFLGMYAAMTRKTITGKSIGSEQSIDLKEAVKMYTVNAAYAAFEEKEKGTIEVGKCADLAVLPEGFMHYSADEVKETNAKMTIIDGEIVYKNKESVHV